MMPGVIPLSAALGVASAVALAQGTGDPTVTLRLCSQMERTQRLECLDKLTRDMAAPPSPLPATENWLISETTSPVDYRPVVVATTYARGGPESAVRQLSIHCRGGRTELVVAGPALSRSGDDYAITYRINAGQPLHAAGSPSLSGRGVAFKGDVVRLLEALPDDGEIAIRVSTRDGAGYDGNFSLKGLKVVRNKVAAACR